MVYLKSFVMLSLLGFWKKALQLDHQTPFEARFKILNTCAIGRRSNGLAMELLTTKYIHVHVF